MIENLVSVTPDDYARLLPTPSTAFGTAAFNMLNSAKVSRIEFLAGLDSDSRPLMGMIAGLRDGIWRSPFSAPMAALSWNRDLRLSTVADFFSKVKQHLSPAPLHLMLPPEFIAPSMLAKIAGTTINMASKAIVEYNYHYDLSLLPDFKEHLHRNAHKNYKRALREKFIVEKTDISRAYAVIAANRQSKGYNLAMSLTDVETTATVIDIDAFTLRHDNTDVAAAIVYRIAPGIAHVVYWGDIPGFEHLRPMNILPYHVFSHYHNLGYRIVNIGTSSTDGIPNHGLCDFKSSLGCTLSLIPTITIHNS